MQKHSFFNQLRAVLPFVLLLFFILLFTITFTLAENDQRLELQTNFTLEYNVTLDQCAAPLSFARSLHFVLSLVTTIGYGDTYPCTIFGQLLSTIVGLFGVPLNVWCLSKVGAKFESVLTTQWNNLKIRISRHKSISLRDEVAPVWLGLLCTVAWVMICATYFYYTLEHYYMADHIHSEMPAWNFFSSLYFTLITLLSIGYGDLAPLTYHLVLVNYVFIFIGHSVISMCISLIQCKVDLLYTEAVKLIEDQYRASLMDQSNDQSIDIDRDGAHRRVKWIMRKLPQGKLLKYFLSDHERKALDRLYREKARMSNVEIQTEEWRQARQVQATVRMVDECQMTDLVMVNRSSQCAKVMKKFKEVGCQMEESDEAIGIGGGGGERGGSIAMRSRVEERRKPWRY